ncbi:pantoate--beta-alanine ligase [Aquimonas voraii]|uniref:Pantothenate synthetase n=1 Tax=Aquimonas voraii TaxID=265719 RepID=A0A1G6XJE8_9GAMM|nr:pantoate--beta-alanine ligase [Aquimonas voraii]SDD78202.1 pantothenate synthetase [Aquimonas voraii]
MSLERVEDVGALRQRIADWRRQGLRVGFVPTMGNLHRGHLALIAQAREQAERVVCSIFVNPTQFGPNEDYGRYPRTLEADASALDAAGCDLLFLPSVEAMYPLGIERTVRVEVPELSDVLCGAFRPGHFAGVATVVARLFNQVQPDLAVFGRKDFQQLAVIRHLVADLAFPIRIEAGETVREPDGLAMSSRNQYLQPEERRRAALIYATLCEVRVRLLAGEAVAAVEAWGAERLAAEGFKVDYLALRRPDRLAAPAVRARGAWVALVAARLGSTRLIDNLEFSLD